MAPVYHEFKKKKENWKIVEIKILIWSLNQLFQLFYRLSNSDYGSHYHSASGANNQIVRGRYGSRNPESGRVEETTYTAGPRG